MMESVTFRLFDNFHSHFREDVLLSLVASAQARFFGRIMVQPNLKIPVTTGPRALRYQQEIIFAEPTLNGGSRLLMTIKATAKTTPKTIYEAYGLGIRFIKVYFEGTTTNSESGIRSFKDLAVILDTVAEINRQTNDRSQKMFVLLHLAKPGSPSVLIEEKEMLPDFADAVYSYPEVMFTYEHVSTAAGIKIIEKLPDNAKASITVHHQILTYKDVYGDLVPYQLANINSQPVENPVNYCKPVANSPEDQGAVLRAACSGNPKFFLGLDDAPHYIWEKQKNKSVKAGVWMPASVAIPLEYQIFEEAGCQDRFEDFGSRFGAEHYGLPLNEGKFTLEEKSWQVPVTYEDAIFIFWGGKTLKWQFA